MRLPALPPYRFAGILDADADRMASLVHIESQRCDCLPSHHSEETRRIGCSWAAWIRRIHKMRSGKPVWCSILNSKQVPKEFACSSTEINRKYVVYPRFT